MTNHRRFTRARQTRANGVTLVLTLLLLAVLTLSLARQTLRAGIARMSGLAESFSLESRWVAEGVAEQWLGCAADPAVDWGELTTDHQWQAGSLTIETHASAAENKISARTVDPKLWLAAWHRRADADTDGVLFVEDPGRTLTDTGYTAIECILDRRHVSDCDAYRAPKPGGAVADLLTVWGEGKVDVNRAPRDVLSTALRGFTDAQVSGILRLREREPIDSLEVLSLKLGLSNAQRDVLNEVAVFAPQNLELLITVRRGRLSAVYRAVVDAKAGRVAEVRVLQ